MIDALPPGLPPLPPNTRYGGRLRDYDQPDVIGHIYEENDGDQWSDMLSWRGMASKPDDDSGDWHVALPIEAVPTLPEGLPPLPPVPPGRAWTRIPEELCCSGYRPEHCVFLAPPRWGNPAQWVQNRTRYKSQGPLGTCTYGGKIIYMEAVIEAVREPAKAEREREIAAFENWLTSTCPSGDAESVHQQWRESSDYADLISEPAKEPAPGDLPSRVEHHLAWLETVRPGWAREIREFMASGVEARVCEDEDAILVEIAEGIIGDLRSSGNDLRSSAFSHIVPWVRKALHTPPPTTEGHE